MNFSKWAPPCFRTGLIGLFLGLNDLTETATEGLPVVVQREIEMGLKFCSANSQPRAFVCDNEKNVEVSQLSF